MLSRRYLNTTVQQTVSATFAACAAAVTGTRLNSGTGVHTTDPTYEDDRWLEAEFANNAEMTIEERYAKEKERDLMKKILGKARSDAKAHVDAHAEKHRTEVADLKKQMADIQAKLSDAEKK